MPKMKVSQPIRKIFAAVGIVSSSTTQACPLNSRVLLGFLLLGLAHICNLKFIFAEAKTFAEYNQSIFLSTFTAMVTSALLILILNVEKLFAFFNDSENIVNSS